jgi:peptidoglycan hydrolase-like protein with peptidoglycan-binding domain
VSKSQNGWPVADKAQCDQGPFLGVKFPNGILHGPVAAIALWQMRRYAATVEPIHSGTCWGWDVRKIEGSSDYSNHASATAWDINAPKHPMGTSPAHSFTPTQIAACRAIERASGGVVRWGGSYTGRPDTMHWEINKQRVATEAFAARIAGKHADLAIGDVGINVTVMQRALNKVPDTGPVISIDGVFGKHTEAKLLHAQSHFRLAADGICGPVTRSKLGLS